MVQGGYCFAVDMVVSLCVVVLVLWSPVGKGLLESWAGLIEVAIVMGVLPVAVVLLVVVEMWGMLISWVVRIGVVSIVGFWSVVFTMGPVVIMMFGMVFLVEVILEHVFTVVVRGEHSIHVEPRWVLCVVLVDVQIAWHLSQS